jgi:diguanylate cyclase (GGDEF)-like protein
MFWDTSFSYASKSKNNSKQNIVRVGYYENGFFQEGASPKAIKRGYAYEYLQKISSYTGWKYEYVYGSWTEMYQALLDGKVDVLAGLAKTKERESLMLYPNERMGNLRYVLYKRSESKDITTEEKSLSGKKIGALRGAMSDYLNEWLLKYKVKAKVVFFDDADDREKALLNKEVDAFLGEAEMVDLSDNIEPIKKIEEREMYLCVSKNRPDLLQQYNEALIELDNEEPYYVTLLSKKYFENNTVIKYLSDKEKKWLNEHKKLTVGYLDNYLPFCDTDSKGNPIGLMVEIIPKIFENLNVKDLKIEYKAYSNGNKLLSDTKKGKIDIAFPVSSNVYFLEKNNLFQSKSIIESTMALVYLSKITPETTRLIAINKNNPLQLNYARMFFKNSKIVYVDSAEECIQAVLHKKANCTIINAYRTNGFLNNSKYRALSSVNLPKASSRCFGVNRNDPALVTLLNRGLTMVGDDYAFSTMSKYQKSYIKYTIFDFMKDHFLETIAFVIILVVILVSFLTIIVMTSKSQHTFDIMAHRDSMTGLLNRRAYEERFNQLLHSDDLGNLVYVSLDINGLKVVNDKLGHSVGDELIIGTAECLKSVFDFYGKVYRTGGDEFIAIVDAEDREVDELKESLKAKVNNWEGDVVKKIYLSYGIVQSSKYPDKSIVEIAKIADNKMYQMKNEFYDGIRKDGKDIRRRIEEKVSLW